MLVTAPSRSLASAFKVISRGPGKMLPFVGEVICTKGGELVGARTTMLTGDEVLIAPALSVARANSVYCPGGTLDQVNAKPGHSIDGQRVASNTPMPRL